MKFKQTHIIAIVNKKGGCGKTTTTVNLAAGLAELGYRVCVADVDDQCDATDGIGIDRDVLKENRWLGITFRKSKTYIHFKDNAPFFPNGERLNLANDDQSKEFYKLRGQENKSMDFTYQDLFYTLSIGDTLMPK